MSKTSPMELRYNVERFLYQEAELLDQWKLDDWLALYTEDCEYQVAPTGVDHADTLSKNDALFLIADDRFRLEQRVIRMKKPTAHAEYPHSRTRHLVSNVVITEDKGEDLKVEANFVVYRTKTRKTDIYMGRLYYQLKVDGDNFRVRYKRAVLDLDNLVPQGKVTIFL